MLIDTDLGPIIYRDEDIYITKSYINIGNDGTNDYLDDVLDLVDTHIGNLNDHLDGAPGKHDVSEIDNAVSKLDFDAYTILAADIDNTPLPLTINQSSFIGRDSTSGIISLNNSEAKFILDISVDDVSVPYQYDNIGNDGTSDTMTGILGFINIELGEKIEGNTGNIDNAILVADGTNGNILKAVTGITIQDNYRILINDSTATAMLDITPTDQNIKGIELNGVINRNKPLLQINEGAGISTSNIFEINSYGSPDGSIFTIAPSGYIGINNTDPNEILSVYGNTSIIGKLEVGFSNWVQVGNGFTITNLGHVAMTTLTDNTIVLMDNYVRGLTTFYFDGTDWSQVGNKKNIPGAGNPALATLNSTDIAFIDQTYHVLTTYRWNGTDWSQIGNSLSISTGAPALTALNSTDVVFIDNAYETLRTYRWDGTNWSQIGNSLSISGAGVCALTTLNSTDIAFIDGALDRLRYYQWDGTDWSQIGNELFIISIGNPALATLNSTTVALIDNGNHILRSYKFDGTDWVPVDDGIDLVAVDFCALTCIDTNTVAFVDSLNDTLKTYEFSGTISLIANNGRIGIGNLVPLTTLDIIGSAGADLFSITDSTLASKLKLMESGYFGLGESDPETHLELTSTAPYITLHNSTEEDSSGGRESKIIFKGEQSGGEETTLSLIEVGHDGIFDNEKGYISICTNDGTDGNSPTERMRILSNGNVGYGVTVPTAVNHIKAGTATAGSAPQKFEPGTFLTVPETGAMECTTSGLFYTTLGDRRSLVQGSQPVITSTTVSDTTDETLLYTTSLAANELIVGETVTTEVFGIMSTHSASDELTLRVKVSDTTITLVVTTPQGITDEAWRMKSTFTVRSVGVAGTVQAFCAIEIVNENKSVANIATTTIDTTAISNVNVTAQWDSAEVDNSITVSQGYSKIIW